MAPLWLQLPPPQCCFAFASFLWGGGSLPWGGGGRNITIFTRISAPASGKDLVPSPLGGSLPPFIPSCHGDPLAPLLLPHPPRKTCLLLARPPGRRPIAAGADARRVRLPGTSPLPPSAPLKDRPAGGGAAPSSPPPLHRVGRRM